jgi:XTP/dITP diphosphohydrolase
MTIVLATRNAHKAQEVAQMLGQGIQVLTLKDVGYADEIIENGETFEDNAKIKVQALLAFCSKQKSSENFEQTILLADDSGLEVDALHGIPGVKSARYAGEPSNDVANLEKLLKVMEGIPGPKRTAQFHCVLAAASIGAESKIVCFDGICRGKIGFKPKGDHGFGYDPIFFPDGFCRTFAEISADEKNEVSHRAKAMLKFKEWLSNAGELQGSKQARK